MTKQLLHKLPKEHSKRILPLGVIGAEYRNVKSAKGWLPVKEHLRLNTYNELGGPWTEFTEWRA